MIDSRPGTRQLGRHHNILLLPSHKFIHVGIVSLKEEVKEKEIEKEKKETRNKKRERKREREREREKDGREAVRVKRRCSAVQ